jgi:hypothetical protein
VPAPKRISKLNLITIVNESTHTKKDKKKSENREKRRENNIKKKRRESEGKGRPVDEKRRAKVL